MGLLAVPLAVIWWPGCREYPVATSIASYGLMEALYTACNTKNRDYLSRVEGQVDQATKYGKLSTLEHDSFHRIIGMARAGEWAQAEQAAYQFADDQRGRGLTDLTGAEEHGHGKKKQQAKPDKIKFH